MGVTVLIGTEFGGDPYVKHKIRERGKRSKYRLKHPRPGPVGRLDLEDELTDLLNCSRCTSGLWMLSSWCPWGRPWFLRGGDFDDLLRELAMAKLRQDSEHDHSGVVDELESLTRRAVAEKLILAVLPD